MIETIETPMTRTELRKRYLAAAITSGSIITAIFFYTVVVEALRRFNHQPPVSPPGAYALKYLFYIMGVSALAVLKFAARAAAAKKETPQETAQLLTKFAVTRAAICELPAVSGLILFILTGGYADFYLLAVFSLGLELYHFPRLSAWEERLRGDFGRLED